MDGNPLASADWMEIVGHLPLGWREAADSHGLCVSRLDADGQDRCKLSNPEVLLRLVLHHVSNGSSLRMTTALAHAAELVSVSPVALHKRMRVVAPWLSEMTAKLTDSATRFRAERWGGYRVFATDATTGTRPGASGTTLRVHYRLDLTTLQPQQVEMTSVSDGEMLRRFELSKGDLDLLDRGYCNPHDLGYTRLCDSEVIVRFNRGTLPLLDARGRPLDIVPKVQRLKRPGRVKSWKASVETPQGRLAVRVCAVRLKAEAAARAQDWMRREANKPVTEADLAWAHFLVVVTTVPEARLSAEQILELFRLRWQVELQIKRDKSIGDLDALPNFREDTIASWICGKLLAQALARGVVSSVPFPPSGGLAAQHAA